jgi:hypothetical protein
MRYFDLLKCDFKKIDISQESHDKLRVGFPAPINDTLLIGADGLDWKLNQSEGSRSGIMWKNSMYWVGSILLHEDRSRHEKFIFGSINSYLFYVKDVGIKKLKSIPSADHSSSLRVNSLLLFYAVYKESISLDCKKYIEEAAKLECYFLMEKVLRAKNNHGFMALISCLNFVYVFGGVEGLNYDKIFSELKRLVDEIFDSSGYSNENTIGYHGFNVKILNEVYCKFSDKIDYDFSWLGDILLKAKKIFSRLVWQNGDVPPIGDSQVQKKAAKSENISTFLPESGFAVVKNERAYLSFICGFRFSAHKHVDDTSITYRLDDEDFITDGGSYNYDSSDPIRQCVSSCNGHSGLFPKLLEYIDKHTYISKRFKVRGGITSFKVLENGYFYFSGVNEVFFEEKGIHFTLKRGAFGDINGCFALLDYYKKQVFYEGNPSVLSKFDKMCVTRFLLSDDLKVIQGRDSLCLGNHEFKSLGFSNYEKSKHIDFYSLSMPFEIAYGGNSTPNRGFISRDKGRYLSTYCVDFVNNEGLINPTIISVNGKSLDCKVQKGVEFAMHCQDFDKVMSYISNFLNS